MPNWAFSVFTVAWGESKMALKALTASTRFGLKTPDILGF
jgi:hypothetical protein